MASASFSGSNGRQQRPFRQVIPGRVHTFLSHHPALFMPYMRLRRRAVNLLADENTEIVIEGYPRSANTFAVVAFRLAQNRDVRIAHHLHAPAQVIWAARRNLPALVLIREPADAVLSLLVRDPSVSITHELRRYARFYSTLEPCRQEFVLATFEEVVNDFGLVIARVNARFGTAFDLFEHTEANVGEVFRVIEEINVGRASHRTIAENTIARPSQERAPATESLADLLSAGDIQPSLARANDVHHRLLASL